MASLIGMEFCDPTTFDVSRLMYWPSCCKDGEYIFEVYDHPFCSLSGLLQMYGDWTDISQWPQVPGTAAIEKRRLAKQEPDYKAWNHRRILPDIHDLSGDGEVHSGDV